MSSTSPSRAIGVIETMLFSILSLRIVPSASVRTDPTAIAFTRTLGAKSWASCSVRNESAALAVPYAANPRGGPRPRHGRDVHHRAAARGADDLRHGEPRHLERRGDVEAEARLELLLAGLERGLGRPAARVVHEEVEPAELVEC